MKIRFDAADAGDGEILVALARAFHHEDGRTLDAAGAAALHQIAAGEPFARAWIVRSGEEAVGYLVLTLGFSVANGGRDGFIDDLYLASAARGQGIGRRLLGFALGEARRLGIRTLYLEVRPDNDVATRLYRNAGFVDLGYRLMHIPLATMPAADGGDRHHSSADATAAPRRFYAEELQAIAHIESDAVVEAFAVVPRERFLGPGPWRIRDPLGQYWTTPNDDPRHVYHNVLIALDEARGINNGEPSLWARLFDRLGILAGDRVLHLGCGTGYYTAIAAELARGGRVTAIELDAGLATTARAALAPWPQVTVIEGDGALLPLAPADVILASAGASHPLPAWIEALKPGGRLLLPMTSEDRWGGMLLATRRSADLCAARFISPAGFIPFSGARDPDISRRLAAALARDRGATVRSLRRGPAPPDETCWLDCGEWFLSTVAADA